MIIAKFDYIAPKTVDEVIKALCEKGSNACVMAGGTDLLIKMRKNFISPKLIISLKKINNLNKISFDKTEGLKIGATVLLSEVAKHDEILKHYPTIAASAKVTANTQIRNMGTIIGNLCNASPSSDNAPILLAMGTILNIMGPNGNRKLALEKFFLGPGITALKPGEIVTYAFVPKPVYKEYGSAYCHISQRGNIDCTAVGVATMLNIDNKNNKFKNVRIFVGACAPTPLRAINAELMLKKNKVNDLKLIHKASIEVSKEVSPISDIRSSADYRRKIVGVLSERAILEAKEMLLRKI